MKNTIFKALLKLDKYLCYLLERPLNYLFVQRNENGEYIGYKFGNINETMSSVFGKNMIDYTLTNKGYLMCSIIEAVDCFYWLLRCKPRPYRDHCISSIEDMGITTLEKVRYVNIIGRSYEYRVEELRHKVAVVKTDRKK